MLPLLVSNLCQMCIRKRRSRRALGLLSRELMEANHTATASLQVGLHIHQNASIRLIYPRELIWIRRVVFNTPSNNMASMAVSIQRNEILLTHWAWVSGRKRLGPHSDLPLRGHWSRVIGHRSFSHLSERQLCWGSTRKSEECIVQWPTEVLSGTLPLFFISSCPLL